VSEHLDENGFVILDPEDTAALAARAIAECDLCDSEGYRWHHVCDHRDYSEAAARGMAAVRAALERGGA